MKKVILIIAAIMFFIGCNGEEINSNTLQQRSGLYYEMGKQEPFTGKGVSYNENGKLWSEVLYNSGKQEGLAKTYYKS